VTKFVSAERRICWFARGGRRNVRGRRLRRRTGRRLERLERDPRLWPPNDDPSTFRLNHEGPYNHLEGFQADGMATYFVIFETDELSVRRLAEGDDAPLLLGKVATKAAGYAGNPFGAAHVLVDESHVRFANLWTADTGQDVPKREGNGAVYRVAR
jgi:hypothetical protein